MKKCDFCPRLYHTGCSDSSKPIRSEEEFKCWVCKLDERRSLAEEEESQPSPPSLSDVSNANTVSNEQTLHNPQHQAMGIDEETPPPDAISKERREEEDTSPSPSSLSNISNANTVPLYKDNRMIKLFESIIINDDEPNKRQRKESLFKIMNDEDHFVLSDEKNIFEQLKQQQINDEHLFKLPPRPLDCPICNIQLPHRSSGKVYMSCCGKVLCRGCIHTIQTDSLCVLCKVPMPDSDEEIVKRYAERIVYDDANSTCTLGCFYQSGMFGLPQSYSKALKLYYWAAALGSAEAYCNMADAYDNGRGVERDYEQAWDSYQLAAMRGNVEARYNLGVSEMLIGNTGRALKHFLIAVNTGHADSLKRIKQLKDDLHISESEWLQAVHSFQGYKAKIEAPLGTKLLHLAMTIDTTSH